MTVNLPPNDILRRIYETREVLDESGRPCIAHSAISPESAWTLYQSVIRFRPVLVVETGMAYGLSTLSILTALKENANGGKLISIDPYQKDSEKGIGLLNVRRAGLEGLHKWIGEPSHVALPELHKRRAPVGFAYLDGSHLFDDVLLDLVYMDKMLPPGGVIGFNDCRWPSVHHTINFLRTHRKYKELDVGLARNYRSHNPLFTLTRRLQGRSSADRYFQKIEDWEPPYNYWKRF